MIENPYAPYTGFGVDYRTSVKFSLLHPDEMFAQWASTPRLSYHPIGNSNTVITQFHGRSPWTVTWRLRLASIDDYERLDDMVGMSSTLRYMYGLTSRVGGRREAIGSLPYLTLESTVLTSLTDVMFEIDGIVEVSATFQRQYVSLPVADTTPWPDPPDPIPLPLSLLFLPLNGTLAGNTQSGSMSASGTGALRYVPLGRKNWFVNTRAAVNTTGWSGVSRVADPAFATEDNPYGYCFEATASATNTGASRSNIDWPYGTGCTIGMDVKWVSGDQSGWYIWGQQSGVGNTGGVYSLTAGDLDGQPHRLVIQHANMDNFAALSLQVNRGPGGGIVTPSTIRFGNITVEEGTTAGTWIRERYWIEHWGVMGTAHTSPSAEAVSLQTEESSTNMLPYGSFRSGANAANPTQWSIQQGTGNNRDWGRHRYVEWNVTAISSPNPVFYAGTGSFAAVTPGTSYTFSIWLLNTMATSRTFNLGVFWWDAPQAVSSGPTTTSVTFAAGEGRRVSITVTCPVGMAWARPQLEVTTNKAVSDKFILREAHFEQKVYATSPVPQFDGAGTLLTGYTYSGTAHQSTSTRAHAYASTPDTPVDVAVGAGSAVVRFKLDFLTSAHDNFILDIGRGNLGGSRLSFTVTSAGFYINSNTNAIGTYPGVVLAGAVAGTEYTARLEWTPTSYRMSINGGAWSAASRQTPIGVFDNQVMIGVREDAYTGSALNGSIRNLMFFNRALTDVEYNRIVTLMDANQLDWTDFGA